MYKRYRHRNNGQGGGRRFNGNRFSSKFRKSDAEIVRAIQAVRISDGEPGDLQNETYVAQNNFESFPISPRLKKNIFYKKYSFPTPIQDRVIPAILENKDIIGIANTGTGKTAAFLIPLIEKVLRNREERVLILTPTRELAMQISDELYGFAYGMEVGWALCIGGTNIQTQSRNLKKHPHFVVGTPGRLKDLAQKGELILSEFTAVVLDEADRMVDIGFLEDIKYFIERLPVKRQSLFFSATIPPKVNQILKTFVKDPITVSVKVRDSIANIRQDIIKINGNITKVDRLHDLLIQEEFEKVLIFGRTKWGVQKLSNELVGRGFNAAAIHGNKTQNQRQKVLDDFKNNKINILLATDVASRGIDVQDISHVINYDLPVSYEDYIHRIGRTGRANKKGVALTFVEN
ncbi:hypothetical protein A2962_02020 [Candidatus Woesebacteria bacterium RIFCSPLOWO2_01_FULL_39_61]|uniref:RNA helicase n=1 Tax=Candidatus Woesebacteria bacterium RIFCSPHIGHO2_02_FULL_39_13 TaxID=1802505 RepID=A0A1F7Z0W0_9BACT|nr:MAG: hypothetical protein A2692_02740 [Candidatus Woesebacteria bacterium RIFCSPHIGHO2_01_FULL_39_95]OGM33286.1 MAG: hypothetical protein A3D01_00660 [Candidatus Woesebacteria bacterium RIFCSPHIGHO2_02_FULL_39_13]OGM38458.1 MAG: hypothetical protein A3E13_00540 [Candidatus Woesebacteria bacterium RIFCSPHIGHO2_12_FULL_40_20]OGM66896.1 MAG: hypothetical protein A2962_02020 [Candidatus Woesebacteria bacterium RIFCSPLOWO2_01_FULL_39_61]OGM75335.1 MAG: hypothetical protein A3H19_02920 [Candidatus